MPSGRRSNGMSTTLSDASVLWWSCFPADDAWAISLGSAHWWLCTQGSSTCSPISQIWSTQNVQYQQCHLQLLCVSRWRSIYDVTTRSSRHFKSESGPVKSTKLLWKSAKKKVVKRVEGESASQEWERQVGGVQDDRGRRPPFHPTLTHVAPSDANIHPTSSQQTTPRTTPHRATQHLKRRRYRWSLMAQELPHAQVHSLCLPWTRKYLTRRSIPRVTNSLLGKSRWLCHFVKYASERQQSRFSLIHKLRVQLLLWPRVGQKSSLKFGRGRMPRFQWDRAPPGLEGRGRVFGFLPLPRRCPVDVFSCSYDVLVIYLFLLSKSS